MDLYTGKSPSIPQKLLGSLIEIVLIAGSGWLMFGDGQDWTERLFGWTRPDTTPARRVLILVFSITIFLRLEVTMFHLMKRRLGWQEALSIPVAFALYYVGFAVLALPSRKPLGAADLFAVFLFCLGCFLNTASEIQRDRFKKRPENKGRLYTQGLFSLSRHINFFGDVLWVCAYAIVADSPWAWLIPLFTFSFFAFFNAPALDRHLEEHYGEQYRDYARNTKMLVPHLW